MYVNAKIFAALTMVGICLSSQLATAQQWQAVSARGCPKSEIAANTFNCAFVETPAFTMQQINSVRVYVRDTSSSAYARAKACVNSLDGYSVTCSADATTTAPFFGAATLYPSPSVFWSSSGFAYVFVENAGSLSTFGGVEFNQ